MKIINVYYNKWNALVGVDFMKKLLLILILAMSTVSCELFSKSYWDRVEKSRREEGRTCYKRADGIITARINMGIEFINVCGSRILGILLLFLFWDIAK